MATQTLLSRTHILHLYRSLLRASQKFSSYNFKDYAYRKTKDTFRENQNETNSERIIQLVQKAEHELDLLRRQGYLNSLYTVDRLVVEDELKGNQKTRLRGEN
ncbi:1767_t:CDS:1 [Funneliformis geosporum]|uniref:19329_t:CDS:1 n=1 Tax=Funneliformis geosporum TaxID=1117311 RepID=A0A9W4WV20_9GLOM|nr:19329_t:CDS:1 [Funneliformis geosporum]CAI2189491.1 1767_t:CDS:1 [Funneliformis geosporum]